MNNTISEMKMYWKESTAEDRTSDLEGKITENTQATKRKKLKHEQSLTELWDNIKHNICIIRVWEEKRERWIKNLF